jgi:predicted nuclease of predicted toxin-antitoxin system
VRIYANENIEAEVVGFLRRQGHDVRYAAEIQPRESDDFVLAFAVSEKRVLLTCDKDFGELCFRRALPSSGVILLRSRDVTAAGRIRVLEAFLGACPDSLEHSFVVLSEAGVRRRTLATGS